MRKIPSYAVCTRNSRPVIAMWDVTAQKVKTFGQHLRRFLARCRPKSLMFAGNCESTFPGLAEQAKAANKWSWQPFLRQEDATTKEKEDVSSLEVEIDEEGGREQNRNEEKEAQRKQRRNGRRCIITYVVNVQEEE
mmetsp:Transcript_16103/g.22601  ORF Transcript_16103/g.22601 Transcript_16103/m.22601 type:complete len:136 (-) Transcript_16103:31-438(-)